MEIGYLSWNESLVAALVFITSIVIWVYFFLRPRSQSKLSIREIIDRGRPPPRPRPKREEAVEPIFARRNNGWVRVSQKVFKNKSTAANRLTQVDMLIPPIVRHYLYTLSISERAWLSKINDNWCDFKQGQDKEEYLDDRRRGLTIGSAFFGYAIPEELVLLDLRTQQLYERYAGLQTTCFTHEEWVSRERDVIEAHYVHVADEFEAKQPMQADKAFQLYMQHEKSLEYLLLHTINETTLLPAIQGVIRGMMWELKITQDEISQHYFSIALTVAIRNLKVQVPLDWMMFSPLSKEVYFMVRRHLDGASVTQQEEKKSHLSLAIDNT